jgi:hypothetical protein
MIPRTNPTISNNPRLGFGIRCANTVPGPEQRRILSVSIDLHLPVWVSFKIRAICQERLEHRAGADRGGALSTMTIMSQSGFPASAPDQWCRAVEGGDIVLLTCGHDLEWSISSPAQRLNRPWIQGQSRRYSPIRR